MIERIKNLSKSAIATIFGIAVAIAQAWLTIDWSSFDIHKEWPKLGLSAIIALGGYFTQLKEKTNG